ncbi:DUF5050 domain-containing protein [Fontibacillus sp. BL9]|uniref:DUF5050 domain-containing protein n=1 Tax=Fontibacillus sp. BL9 TaxID=3389971 RepID=UPI00397E7A21
MNGNIHSGGLALKKEGNLFLTDLRNYSGTFLQKEETGDMTLVDGVFWFMNPSYDAVYYSDQAQGNRLCRWNMASQTSEMLLDRPVYGLIRSEDWLYYVSETDQKIYRCLLNGKNESRITDEPVEAFVVEGNLVYYATQQGIRSCSPTGSNRELVSESAAVHLIKMGHRLAFADKKNRYLLSVFDLHTGETQVYEDISPSSLNTDGRYLYCANRSNENSIYRIDPETGSKIRICGESADYLHILDDSIYFCSRLEWYRMSLSGGQAAKVLTMS